jgi:hypothetical protein
MWDARAGSLNRMNRSQREGGVLAEHIRKIVGRKTRCKIEIRAAKDSEARVTADRLLTSLRAGGLEGEIVEVGTAPEGELLIESSHETAGVALALQSAFLAIGTAAQLLVHAKARSNWVVLHLGKKE